jgi:hypothetical protein
MFEEEVATVLTVVWLLASFVDADCVTASSGGNSVYCDAFGPREWVPFLNVTHVTLAGPFFHPTFDSLKYLFPNFEVSYSFNPFRSSVIGILRKVLRIVYTDGIDG